MRLQKLRSSDGACAEPPGPNVFKAMAPVSLIRWKIVHREPKSAEDPAAPNWRHRFSARRWPEDLPCRVHLLQSFDCASFPVNIVDSSYSNAPISFGHWQSLPEKTLRRKAFAGFNQSCSVGAGKKVVPNSFGKNQRSSVSPRLFFDRQEIR